MHDLVKRLDPVFSKIRGEVNPAIQECRKMKKPFTILFFIYLLGISAILRANFNYIDDMGRVYSGYKGWENFSRHTNMFLSGLLHADNYLTDISPLPQLLAVVLLVLTSMAVLYIISGTTEISLWSVIAVIPLGLSPYFLECISYKYDAPYMALSIFASVVPLLFYRRGSIPYLTASILGMLIVCTTYQAAVGLFPMMVILASLLRWNQKEPLVKIASFILDSLISFVVALLLFQLFLRNGYSGYVDMSLPPMNQLFSVITQNYAHYFSLIKEDLKTGWLFLIAVLCILFLYVNVRNSEQNKTAAFCVSSGAMLVMLLLSFGVYPAFQKPLFDPRAMFGFGVFIALVAVVATTGQLYTVKLSKIICLILSWCFFVFAFTYGNALYAQKKYTDFRIQMVVDDLKSTEVMMADNQKKVEIIGSIGHAPALKNMPQDYQILNRLVPITFQGNWHWGRFGIQNYYGLKNLEWTAVDAAPEDLPVIADSIYHTIRANQDNIIIVLK